MSLDDAPGPVPAPVPFPVQPSAYLKGYVFKIYRMLPPDDDGGVSSLPDRVAEFSPEEMFGIASVLTRATNLTTINGVNFIGKLLDLIRVKE